jgi:hypothetical protein
MGSFDKQAYSRRLVERFSAAVELRLESSVPADQRTHLAAIASAALADSIASLENPPAALDHGRTLPVARLKAAEVIAQARTGMSQATLYRAAESGRCYSVTPGGLTIGKLFPAWQFVEPVPELIAPVLACLAARPGSEVHAFWVTAADALNDLCPAELLAGLPFETRGALHPSQQVLLGLPSGTRQKSLVGFAQQQSSSSADVIA